MAEAAAAAAAAAGGGWTKHVTCRYFLHGLCKEGDNCRYSHDLNSKPATMSCRFFQKGNCLFGERCRFEHCKPSQKEESPSSSAPLLPSNLLLGPADSEPTGSTSLGVKDWADAAEFVPGQPYCGRVETGEPTETAAAVAPENNGAPIQEPEAHKPLEKQQQQQQQPRKQLCPYAAVGECRYGLNCAYLHGDVCDLCGLQALHPTELGQRSQHTKACIEAHEKDMEISFAVQRSKDMMCGVCMEVVFEKANPSERRFGILSNCAHCYCLKCIRKWRSAKQFESKIIKSCPECRITSNFVIPSEYWVEDKDDKQKLIQKYKDGMGSKACRYFDQGRGSCPFGSNCFYKHAFPDGRLEEVQPPRRNTSSSSSSRTRSSRRTPLWELLAERERSSGSGEWLEQQRQQQEEEDVEQLMTLDLSEMLLMLLAAETDDEATDSEDEWDLFHDELDDFYEIYL